MELSTANRDLAVAIDRGRSSSVERCAATTGSMRTGPTHASALPSCSCSQALWGRVTRRCALALLAPIDPEVSEGRPVHASFEPCSLASPEGWSHVGDGHEVATEGRGTLQSCVPSSLKWRLQAVRFEESRLFRRTLAVLSKNLARFGKPRRSGSMIFSRSCEPVWFGLPKVRWLGQSRQSGSTKRRVGTPAAQHRVNWRACGKRWNSRPGCCIETSEPLLRASLMIRSYRDNDCIPINGDGAASRRSRVS